MGERVDFRHKAILLHQTDASKLFAGHAAEINLWSGIPQKKRFGTGDEATETAGFQREQNPARIKSLQEFYRDEHNVIQNPLLCATRELPDSKVTFIPDARSTGKIVLSEVVVTIPDDDAMLAGARLQLPF
jgi:hypothetical protein